MPGFIGVNVEYTAPSDTQAFLLSVSVTQLQRAIVTTTPIDSDPSANSKERGSSVPIPAIVGGVVAGALLAVLVTAGWVYWGKSIKRSQAKRRREVEAERWTKSNTLHNASISRPRVHHAYRPLFGQPLEKSVKFASADAEKSTSRNVALPSPTVKSTRNISRKHETHLQTLPESDEVLRTTINAPMKRAHSGDATIIFKSQPYPKESWPNLVPAKKLPRRPSKQSTIDSASVYSTASGEERQVRVPTNLILAALGNLGNTMDAALNRNSMHGGERQSVSSGWSLFSRNNIRDHSLRLSQASRDSAEPASQQAPVEDYPMGTAV